LKMPYLLKTLKMKLRYLLKILPAVLLAGFYSHAQTVYITRDITDTKEKKPFFGKIGAFSNFSFSLPFRANPEYGTNDPYTGEQNKSWFLPDGLNFQGGFGFHTGQTIALSLNAGIDGMISPKLVAAPVYGSIILRPKFNDDTAMIFQYGIGKAFALGRGDLSGLYQKYRLGFTDDENLGFFVEANYYGFGVYDIKQVSTISIGICILNFD